MRDALAPHQDVDDAHGPAGDIFVILERDRDALEHQNLDSRVEHYFYCAAVRGNNQTVSEMEMAINALDTYIVGSPGKCTAKFLEQRGKKPQIGQSIAPRSISARQRVKLSWSRGAGRISDSSRSLCQGSISYTSSKYSNTLMCWLRHHIQGLLPVADSRDHKRYRSHHYRPCRRRRCNMRWLPKSLTMSSSRVIG